MPDDATARTPNLVRNVLDYLRKHCPNNYDRGVSNGGRTVSSWQLRSDALRILTMDTDVLDTDVLDTDVLDTDVLDLLKRGTRIFVSSGRTVAWHR